MNVTLFGYPKTGKTTLFNLLSGARVEVAAYDDGKKDPNIRTCPVPSARLERIAALYPDKKKVPAALDLVDLRGISYGEVKDSLLLGELRKADGLVHVVRGFLNPLVPHPRPKITPQEDIRIMEDDLILADLVLAESRLEKLDKDLKKVRDPEGEKERDVLTRLIPHLEATRSLRTFPLLPAEEKLLRSFAFLSRKPLLHMVNLDEKDLAYIDRPGDLFPTGQTSGKVLAFCGKIESEIGELPEEEKASFMESYGLKGMSTAGFWEGLPRLMGVISFLTVGKDEVRAWMIKEGTTASKAAGAIHTDIEKGFIRAEVISSEELLRHGSLQNAKEAGAVRLEGKDYPVEDGDVIYFRFTP